MCIPQLCGDIELMLLIFRGLSSHLYVYLGEIDDIPEVVFYNVMAGQGLMKRWL